MPMSDYVASLRSRIGTDFLLLPGVTAVIRDRQNFLLARHRHSGDQVGYVTTAYDCELTSDAAADGDELLEIAWFPRDAIPSLPRRGWIDRVISDVRDDL